MHGYAVIGIVLVSIFIVWWEFRSLTDRKTRALVLVLTLATCVLAVLLLLYPDLPGPTEFVNYLLGYLDK